MQIAKIQTTQLYKKIIALFIVCALILFGLIAYFSLSKTVITVALIPQDKDISFTILATDKTGDGAPSEAHITGTLAETEISGNQNFENTNEGEMQEAQATGKVTIYNNWSQTQALAATTRLLSPDGTLFRIKNRVDVPAGGKIDGVEIYADQPGESGNIEPAKFTIPGLWPGLQEKIYAVSNEPTTGGMVEAKIITQTMINNKGEELRTKLEQEAVQKMIQDNDQLRNKKAAVGSVILSSTSVPEGGLAGSSFTLNMKLNVMAVYFDESEMQNAATAELVKSLAEGEELANKNSDTLNYTINEYDKSGNTARLNVKYSAKAVPRLSSPIFDRDNLTGRDEQEIKAYFSNFNEIGQVKIKFSPFWVTKAPGLKDHIEIKIGG